MKDIQKFIPKIVFEVVYRSKDGTWRGFCAPYDISYTAESAKDAMKKIDELVEIYEEGLKKYGYPPHLTIKELSDEEDQKVFHKVLTFVMKDIKKRMLQNLKKFYQENEEVKFTLKDYMQARGQYSFPVPTAR